MIEIGSDKFVIFILVWYRYPLKENFIKSASVMKSISVLVPVCVSVKGKFPYQSILSIVSIRQPKNNVGIHFFIRMKFIRRIG